MIFDNEKSTQGLKITGNTGAIIVKNHNEILIQIEKILANRFGN